MAKVTGGLALAKSLYQEGVRVIFGLPGVQLYHALDALGPDSGIRFITTRHEQATAYMADGYARAGHGIGTAMVVPGPGLLNAAAAIGSAYAASSPVLVVTGQIERDLIGVGRGVLHEVSDQLGCVRPITKWSASALHAAEIPGVIHEAFRQLRSGRPRPVVVEMPPDAFREAAEIAWPEPSTEQRPGALPGNIREAASVLAGATRPLIWAGAGVIASGASTALEQVAEYLAAPVITTYEGKGALSERHPLSLGCLRPGKDPLKPRLTEYDVVLAVGTRFATFGHRSGPTVIQIDIDPAEIGRNYPQTVGVVGDARRSLEALHQALAEVTPPRPNGHAAVAALRAERLRDPWMSSEPVAELVHALRRAIPDDGILVPDLTQVGYYSRVLYPVYQPGTYLTSSYFGTLGFAFPTALGAKVACPERAVVSISGDGGFLFCAQELATAVQHGIHTVHVLFNDNAYGNVLRDQDETFGRTVGSELQNPDFGKLVESFGARAVRVESPAQLGTELRKALAMAAVTVIEVPIMRKVPSPFR